MPPEEPVKCTLSESNGDYTLEGLLEGSYKVQFEDPPDYEPQYYAGKATLAEAALVAVTAGAATEGVDAALLPTGIHHEGGSIEGRVTSAATSAPLGGVLICAFAPPQEEPVECALSEADGDYTVEDLPEGSYKVEFFDSPDYGTQYYTGKATLAEATPVAVSSGAAVKGIDAALAPAEHNHAGGSIEGRVTAAATGSAAGGRSRVRDPAVGSRRRMRPDGGRRQLCGRRPARRRLQGRILRPPGLPAPVLDEAASITGATTIHVAAASRRTGINGRLKAFVPAPTLAGGIQTQSPSSTGSSGTPSGTSAVLPTKAVVPSVTAGARVQVSGRRGSVKLHCGIGPCHGTVQLTITLTRRHRAHGHTLTRRVTLLVGSGSFSLAQGASGKVTVHLSSQAGRLLATAARHPRAGRLKLVLQGASTTLHAVVVS